MESGHTPSRQRPEYWGGDIPWIGIRDAKKFHGGTISETLETTNENGIANSSARVLPKGTVCLSRTASVGYVVKMGRDMATSQDFANWVCSDQLDPDYLVHVLLAEAGALSRFSSGSVHQTIYYPELKAFHICLPPLEDQRRIVAILDEAFEGLDRARANADANLAGAGELFESALETELLASGSWDQDNLGNHIDLLAGFAFKSAGYSQDPHDVRLMRGDNIVPGAVRWDGARYWPKKDCGAYERFQLKAGDVLIAMDRTWINAGIKFAVLSDEDTPSLLVQRVARLRCYGSLDARFLAMLIGSKAFERYVLSIQTGTGVPHISPTQIRAFRTPVPKIEEQRRIVERVLRIKEISRDLTESYTAARQDIDDLRQSLLQKVFAGELT
ncbi:MAG: restriction endonuclease subunit S [Mesorhizobium sp.]|nr:restriction endonuclease subunit S [Mesorhizobium sp.]